MKNLKTKKAMEVIKKYEEKFGEKCQVFKGRPDARYSEGYFVYAATCNGYAAVGTYGNLLAHSKTLKGLL